MIKNLNELRQDFKEVLELNNIRGYALSLEFSNLSRTIKTSAQFTQSDMNTSVISIQLLNQGAPIILERSTILYVNVKRADGTTCRNECTVLDGNTGAIVISFNQKSTEIVGTTSFEIVVISAGAKKILSPQVAYKVFESIDAFSEVPTPEDVKIVDIMVNEVVAIKEAVIVTNETIAREMIERNAIEANREKAESLRNSNESTRDANEDIRVESELSRIEKEEARLKDETTRSQNEEERKLSETNRENNETNRINKEKERLDQETKRTESESTRVANENIRVNKESERAAKETTRNKSEKARIDNEEIRLDNETIRSNSESTRTTNELTRNSNESKRIKDETTRTTKEAERVEAEIVREDSEAFRVAAEVEREKKIVEFGSQLGDNATAHYDENLKEYVGLKNFWEGLRTGKRYTVEFNQFEVTPSSIGTKKDDNVGLICEPSTNIIKGINDYENIGLFMAIDVNAYVDEDDDYHVTGIKGDNYFKNDGSNGDVYVMAMPGYIKRYSGDNAWSISYSDSMLPGYEIIDEAVKIDGAIRPFLLHAKYIAGRNPFNENKLASISGVSAEYNGMSHDGQITEFKKKGVQYSGKTSHDDFYIQMMFWLKYATLNSESIMKGCMSYYLQYKNLVVENGVKNIVVTTAQANTLIIGSTVSVGDYRTGTINADRQLAQNCNLANRVKIVAIENLNNGNSAVFVDSKEVFDTSITTTISTYPWKAGGCDNVLGVDGSPNSNISGKDPYIINGVEIMVGGYEVLQNIIIYNNNTDVNNYKIQVFVNYDCKTYATSVTSNYKLMPYELAQTNNTWEYASKIKIDANNPSIVIPVETRASSTTGFADGIYTNTPNTGYRAWLSLGFLYHGSFTGLRCLDGLVGLGIAYWNVLGRLSATGRSRRRAGVN